MVIGVIPARSAGGSTSSLGSVTPEPTQPASSSCIGFVLAPEPGRRRARPALRLVVLLLPDWKVVLLLPDWEERSTAGRGACFGAAVTAEAPSLSPAAAVPFLDAAAATRGLGMRDSPAGDRLRRRVV